MLFSIRTMPLYWAHYAKPFNGSNVQVKFKFTLTKLKTLIYLVHRANTPEYKFCRFWSTAYVACTMCMKFRDGSQIYPDAFILKTEF